MLVNHYYLADKFELQNKWARLYAASNHNVFLNWRWMDAWLNTVPSNPIILEATYQEECVGLGIVCSKSQRVFFGLLNINQLWLHKCGDEKLDQMWIEHNDFLLHSQYEKDARVALINYIHNTFTAWGEFYLGMSSESLINAFAILGKPRIVITSPDYEVDLRHVDNLESYLKGRSKNTRSQILRSRKLLSQNGNLELRLAKTIEDKNAAFSELGNLHQKKWRSTSLGSGFDNTVFVNFHKHIIFEDKDNHYSSIYSLELDGSALSYIYLLKTNEYWYFYLSGMQVHADNKIKIGLVTHTLLIEQAILHGIKKYSFLAGDARYKKSMSNKSDGIQALVCFTRPSIFNFLLNSLRQLKRLLSHLKSNRE